MDVHPPDSPIHSVKEFMIHLLAITIGLLIALGLESIASLIHHRHQARESREEIRQELSTNREMVSRHLDSIPGEIKFLDGITAQLESEKAGGQAKPMPDYNWGFPLLVNSAWQTANSVGTLRYMDYEDVKGYAAIYAEQSLTTDELERNVAVRRELFQLSSRMSRNERLTAEECDQGEQVVEGEKFGVEVLKELDQSLLYQYNRVLGQVQ